MKIELGGINRTYWVELNGREITAIMMETNVGGEMTSSWEIVYADTNKPIGKELEGKIVEAISEMKTIQENNKILEAISEMAG